MVYHRVSRDTAIYLFNAENVNIVLESFIFQETTEIEHLNRLLIQTTGKDSFYKVKNDTNKVLAKQTGKNSEEAPGTCKQVLVSQDQCEA